MKRCLGQLVFETVLAERKTKAKCNAKLKRQIVRWKKWCDNHKANLTEYSEFLDASSKR